MELKFEFSKEENDNYNRQVLIFAGAMLEKDQSAEYYLKSRNAPSLDKVTLDSMVGKKGEFFVSQILHRIYGYPLVEPDLVAYATKQKKWGPDLYYSDWRKFHVKTCSQTTRCFVGDYSWMFEKNDVLFKHGSDNDIIALMYLENWSSSTGILKTAIPYPLIAELFKPPKSWKHKKQKTALYFKTLPKIDDKYIRESSLSLIR